MQPTVKKQLQKIIKQHKLVGLENAYPAKRKAIQFLEEIIDAFGKNIVLLLEWDRQNEIDNFFEEERERWDYWLQFHNRKSGIPSKYNGLVYFFINTIAALVGRTDYVKEKAWSKKEVNDFNDKHIQKNEKQPVFDIADIPKSSFKFLSDGNLGNEVKHYIKSHFMDFDDGEPTQKQFDNFCRDFNKYFGKRVKTLDSEDREKLIDLFNKIAGRLRVKNFFQTE